MTKTLEQIAKDYLRGMYGDEPEKNDAQEDYVERVIAAYGYEPQWDANWVRSAFECGKIKSTSKWISVKERLPEMYERVLVLISDKVFISSIEQETSCDEYSNELLTFWDGWDWPEISHWMPLPKTPRNEE